MAKLKSVQRRTAKKNWVFTLEKRRLKGMFDKPSNTKEFYKEDGNELFVHGRQGMSNWLPLQQDRYKLDSRQDILTLKVIKFWNRLLQIT